MEFFLDKINKNLEVNEKLVQLLTNNYKYDMLVYVYRNPEIIADLLELALQNDPKLSWRATWLFCDFKEKYKHLIEEKQSRIIKILPLRKDNHQRELLKLISGIEIYERNIAFLFDICLKIWVHPNKQASVKFNAFKIMLNLAEKYPIFHSEIIFFTEDRFIEKLSPGAKHSIKKIVHEFKLKNIENIVLDEFDC